MAPMETSESDELDRLPSVPRRRSTGGKPPLPSRDSSKSREERFRSKRQQRESPRNHKKRGRRSLKIHSDDDDMEESLSPPVPRSKRVSRRASAARKVIDDYDDDDDDEDSMERDSADTSSKASKDSGSKSNSISPPRSKKRRISIKESSSDSKDMNEDDDGTGNEDGEGSEIIPGQNDILAQLEEENNSEDFGLDDSEEEEKDPEKRRERLTSRQRALQGEDIQLEYSKLESPKAKKKSDPTQEWEDEEMELKKQQKARLRQMVHEKRNKEKRAAMVDKVLRGVTSKRKKFTMASEARAAQVGTRLTSNEMREGCLRFVSNHEGISVSLPKDVEVPRYLGNSIKAAYPPACKRDPKTGKRILTTS